MVMKLDMLNMSTIYHVLLLFIKYQFEIKGASSVMI